jgi:hypothetical protein
LQLLALLTLVQDWFLLSMQIEGRNVDLGSFDGATTFVISMPLSLLALATLLIAAISGGYALYSALALIGLANLGNLVIVGGLLLRRDLSALDNQLDRLTGIANTHGLSDLTIEQTLYPVAWLSLTIACVVTSITAIVSAGRWLSASKDRALATKPAKPKPPESSIDLWDSQRG